MAKMTKEQVQEFIERVENLIVLRNMSKAEFYEKAGYTDAAYSQWVTGQTTPSTKSINKTAIALGVEATYLITGENKKSAPAVSGKSDSRRLLDSYLDEFTEAEIAELLAEIKEKRNNQE